ncbi:hypothetical protein SUGI_1173770 [Cryptomeria japonica]|nr:hypothetical protein SUGI_1173770 [Cryptomeria japonica]
MKISRKKFEQLVGDGQVRKFSWELLHSYTRKRSTEERNVFEVGLSNFIAELDEKRKTPVAVAAVNIPKAIPLPEFARKKQIWMKDSMGGLHGWMLKRATLFLSNPSTRC